MRPGPAGAGSPRPPLRLVPPPADDTPAPLSLLVGDLVVYASHGIGRVEGADSAEGEPSASVSLAFASGLRVTLPRARAGAALRPLSGEPELDEVRRTLREDVPPANEPWARRHRATQEKVAAGRIRGLAEVVRDGLRRERRAAGGAGGRPAAPSERELYLRARALLAAEIAACRGIDSAAADAWIVQQVSA
ncbi:MAG TPA: CarD family transcriptional regulator [Gaiellaceae bacterium]|nr:CarD family transcriptional regulator [Gaiellaceae bacterium]